MVSFGSVLHHLSSLTRLTGSWGQLLPKTDPTQPKTKMIIFHRGLTATKDGLVMVGNNLQETVRLFASALTVTYGKGVDTETF